jgi:hypothetical protein
MADPFATPIDKLPPPIMQSRQDVPSSNSPLNYTDILKDIETETQAGKPHAQVAQTVYSQNVPQQPQGQQQMDYGQPPGGGYPQQQQQWEQAAWAGQGPSQLGTPQPTQQGWERSFFQDNKTMFFAAFVFFIVLFYLVPRVKMYIPQLVHDGNMSAVGVGALSLLAGLLYQVSDKYIT